MYKNLAATLVAACFISSAFSQSPLKIGFVYVAPVTDAGWVQPHDEGHKAVEAALSDEQIRDMNFLVQGVQGKLTP